MDSEERFEDKGEIKKPEFIYVETEDYHAGHEYGGFQEEFKQSYQKMGSKNYPIAVRFVCFVCAFFIFFFLLLATPFQVVFAVVNTLTLFQWKTWAQRTKQVWQTYSKMFVTVLGLLLAVISPPFGLSVILVYLMMNGQKTDDVWVQRIFEANRKK